MRGRICILTLSGAQGAQQCLTLCICLLLVNAQTAKDTAVCHALPGDVCGTTCQQHICQALGDLYNATHEAGVLWDNQQGWELTASSSCEQLVLTSPLRPVYCSWFGVVCCTAQLVTADKCNIVNTVQAVNITMNHLLGSIEDPLFVGSIQQLHDCGLTEVNFAANELEGSLTTGLLTPLVNIRTLDLSNNWIHGTIPLALSRLEKLEHLDLSNNWLSGSVPSFLGNLTHLQVIKLGSQAGTNGDVRMQGLQGSIPDELGNLPQLRQLTLELNSLTGTLPPGLCSNGGVLQVLNVQANNLQGNATTVESCRNLVQLNLAENAFTGYLPASSIWDMLVTYKASQNQFSGTFPTHLAPEARVLEFLDISSNSLTGMLPNEIVLMASLTSFDASNNKFTGTISENIYYLPLLSNLDVSGNLLVGTIDESIELSSSLIHMDISDNPGISGVLPPQLGLLEYLHTFNAMGTSLSCSGIMTSLPFVSTANSSCKDPSKCAVLQKIAADAAKEDHACDPHNSLPCFLQYSTDMAPRGDNSNMRCKWILRRGHKDAKTTCASNGTHALADQAELLPDVDQLSQMWFLDPSYSQYRNCECLLGYSPSWNADGTVLTCTAQPSRNVTLVVILVTVTAMLIVMVAGMLTRMYFLMRPRWLRERQMQAKLAKGAPTALKPGEKVAISIAVTDVKDYSDMTRRHPDLMKQAMSRHNHILRKACHAHAGYVVCQEGDSWTVAFHDAQDAVAFSLQVQQALARKFQQGGISRSFTGWLTHRTFSKYDLARAATMAGLRSTEGQERESSTGQYKFTAANRCETPPDMQHYNRTTHSSVNESHGGDRPQCTSPNVTVATSHGGNMTSAAPLQSTRPHGSMLQDKTTADTGSSTTTDVQQFIYAGIDSADGSSGRPKPQSTAQAVQLQSELQACTTLGKMRGSGQNMTAADMQQYSHTGLNSVNGSSDGAKGQSTTSPMAGQLRSVLVKGCVLLDKAVGSSVDVPAVVQQTLHTRPNSINSSGDGALSTAPPLQQWPVLSEVSTSHSQPPAGSASGFTANMQQHSRIGFLSVNSSNEGGKSPGTATPPMGSLVHGSGASVTAQMRSVQISDLSVCFHENNMHRKKEPSSPTGGHFAQMALSSAAGGAAMRTARRSSDSCSTASNSTVKWWDAPAVIKRLSRTIVGRSSKASVPAHLYSYGQTQTSELSITVRIGVATGTLQYGCDVCECEVKERAKELVSEVANGGQVLIDQTTFLLVKHSLHLLGTVTQAGYNDKLLQQMAFGMIMRKFRKVVYVNLQRYFSKSSHLNGEPHDYDKLALAVHLGTFEIPCSADDADACKSSTAVPRGAQQEDVSNKAMPAESGRSQQHQLCTLYTCSSSKKQELTSEYTKPWQLYSIAAPGMRRAPQHGCDSGWAQSVRMLSGWVKTEKSYFDAPGALYSHLVPASQFGERDPPTLQDMTIVFIGVAHTAGLKSELGIIQTHNLNQSIRQNMLQQLNVAAHGDGYLCNQLGSKFKYMLAFEQPHLALQWCLLVQEAMMYADWPEQVLALPGFSTVLDPATGQPIFRGPRLRMGIACGQLNSVQPDHAGRADYYGECVNRAARYMDAAAHGGQVVTDLPLLHDIFHQWAEAAEDGLQGPASICLLGTREPASLHSKPLSRMSTKSGGKELQQLSDCASPKPLQRSSVAGSFPCRFEDQQRLQRPAMDMVRRSRSEANMEAIRRFTLVQQQEQHSASRVLEPSLSGAIASRGRSFTAAPVLAGCAPSTDKQVEASVQSVGCACQEEPVTAWHLGTFTFKGSGEYDMAHVLPASLAGRTFPDEPPTGKGARLAVASGPVMGLPDVRMQVPKQVYSARQQNIGPSCS